VQKQKKKRNNSVEKEAKKKVQQQNNYAVQCSVKNYLHELILLLFLFIKVQTTLE